MVKNPPANMGDVGSTSGLKRSPGGGNDNPLSILFFFSLSILVWEIPRTEDLGRL